MDTLIHADIFFFVSTIALIIISFCLIVVLFYAMRILRDFSVISKKIREESVEIIEDVKMLRGDIKREGLRLGRLAKFFGMMTKKAKPPKRESEE